MHQELKISPDQSLYYRYNPQGDVLAVRFEPRFDPGREEPVADMPQVSLIRDESSGDCLGLRIEGVQQMILGALVRDVFARLRPELESAGAIEPAPVRVEPAASTPAPPRTPAADVQPGVDASASEEQDKPEARSESPTAEAAEDEAPDRRREKKRRRRRRRRGRERTEPEPEARAERGDDPEASGTLPEEESSEPVEATDDSGQMTGQEETSSPSPESASSEIRSAVSSVASALRKVTGVRDAGDVKADEADVDEAEADRADADEADADAADARDLAAEASDSAEARAEVESRDDAQAGSPVAADADVDASDDEAASEATPETSSDDASSDAEAGSRAETSGMRFDELDLHPQVAAAIAKMGFTRPTPIQEQAIPVAIQGRDVVGLAQTGTGKTLAFVAPALHRMLVEPSEGGKHVPRLLVLAPTRELTVQVAEEAERLAAESKLRITTIYGGVSMGPQVSDLKRGVDVIVATPGRMLDHLRRGNVKLGTVETLVLDEADRMLDMGFLPDVRTILRFLPAKRQTLFFTATMPPEIESLSLEFQTDPATVEIARRKPPESIDQRLYPVGKHLKAPLLVHLLQSDKSMQSVLVFTERKIDADVLSRRLRQEGLKVAVMHGDRRQSDREKALSDLAEGRVQVLVATNVAARGLDIDDISHVVNYDVPQTVDEYVHRIGRTARAEAEGSAWTLVTVSDEMMISRIEGALDRKLPRVTDETFDYDVPTPSWAKPSAKDVLAMLNRKQTRADRMRHLGRKR